MDNKQCDKEAVSLMKVSGRRNVRVWCETDRDGEMDCKKQCHKILKNHHLQVESLRWVGLSLAELG